MNADNMTDITTIPFEREIMFSATRSSGPGGQHVNKVSSKVELRFNIPESALLTIDQKEILLEKLKNRLTQEGILIVVSGTTRSQLKNRETAMEKFYEILKKAFKPPKKRIATKPSRSAKEKRLENKRKVSEKKVNRKLTDD
jgi:ribosome-associated protein